MSTPSGPSRRRRIAGETSPAESRQQTAKKIPTKKVAKTATEKSSARAASISEKPASAKAAVPKRTSAPKPPAAKAPTVARPAMVTRPPAAKAQPAGGLTDTDKATPKPATGTSRPSLAVPAMLRRDKIDEPSAPGPRVRLKWAAPIILIAVAALVFGSVFGIKGWQDYRASSGYVETGKAATAEAGRSAQTIFSFQFNKLDEHLENSQAVMTPSFAKEFESIAPALTELAPQREVVVRAEVREAAAVECGSGCADGRRDVLVYLDQARLTNEDEVPTVFGNRIVMTMVKSDNQWLVNEIKAL